MTTAHAFAYETDLDGTDDVLDLVQESVSTLAVPADTSRDAEARLADLAPLMLAPDAVEALSADGETAFAQLVPSLRKRDGQLAATLLAVAADTGVEACERALAIEVLAAARVPAFEPWVVNCILRALDCEDQDVRFAAVAAASDISAVGRVAFRRRLRLLATEEEPSPSVRRAAQAILRADDAASR